MPAGVSSSSTSGPTDGPAGPGCLGVGAPWKRVDARGADRRLAPPRREPGLLSGASPGGADPLSGTLRAHQPRSSRPLWVAFGWHLVRRRRGARSKAGPEAEKARAASRHGATLFLAPAERESVGSRSLTAESAIVRVSSRLPARSAVVAAALVLGRARRALVTRFETLRARPHLLALLLASRPLPRRRGPEGRDHFFGPPGVSPGHRDA